MRWFKCSFFMILCLVILYGCQTNTDSPSSEVFQFNDLHGPNDWDIVLAAEYFPVQALSIGTIELAEQPNELRLIFGKKSETNELTLSLINKEEQERQAKFRTIYAHSYEETYAEMSIWEVQEPVDDEENALEKTIFQSLKDRPYIEVGEKNIYYYQPEGKENPMFYLWFSEDRKYRYSFAHLETLPIKEMVPFLEKMTEEFR